MSDQSKLSDEQILKIVRDTVQGKTLRLTRDVGPYEVTEPTHELRQLLRAVERALSAQEAQPAEPNESIKRYVREYVAGQMKSVYEAYGAQPAEQAAQPVAKVGYPMSPVRIETGNWCAPGDRQQQRWMLTFDDADRGHALYTDETEARDGFARAEALGWNCYLWKLDERQAAQPVAHLVALELERLAQDAPISGNTLAQTRVLMAAANVREFGLAGGAAPQAGEVERAVAEERERCAKACRDKAAEWLKRSEAGDMPREKARHARIAAGQIEAAILRPNVEVTCPQGRKGL